MKVELSIADDRELKSFIKDAIKAEIVSIARGEVKGILAEVIKEGYIPKSQSDIDTIIRNEIKSIIQSSFKISSWNTSEVLSKIAREEINLQVKNIFKSGAV